MSPLAAIFAGSWIVFAGLMVIASGVRAWIAEHREPPKLAQPVETESRGSTRLRT